MGLAECRGARQGPAGAVAQPRWLGRRLGTRRLREAVAAMVLLPEECVAARVLLHMDAMAPPPAWHVAAACSAGWALAELLLTRNLTWKLLKRV